MSWVVLAHGSRALTTATHEGMQEEEEEEEEVKDEDEYEGDDNHEDEGNDGICIARSGGDGLLIGNLCSRLSHPPLGQRECADPNLSQTIAITPAATRQTLNHCYHTDPKLGARGRRAHVSGQHW